MSCIITVATCELPFYYDDEYEIAGRDKLHMNSTMIVDYPLSIPGTNRRNFGCIEKQGDIYLLKGTEEVNIFNQLTTLYMCLEIHQVSNTTYYYFYKTGYDVFLRDYLIGSKTGEPTFDEACTETTDQKAFIMISKKESYEEGLLNTTCPQDILAVFDNVNITRSSGTTTTRCPGTTVDVCTDRTTVAFTYNSTCAAAKMTSEDGKYSCLFSLTLGSETYLGVWNQDTTVDSTSTFRFSCFAYSITGDVLYATETPTACTSTTTSTDLGSATDGVTIVAWNIILRCPDRVIVPVVPESPVDLTWLYYLAIGLGIIFLVILFCILSVCLYKKYGCVCLRRKPLKIRIPTIKWKTNKHTMIRQESQTGFMVGDDKSAMSSSLASRNLSNSSEADLPDVFKPKQPVQDFTMISAIFKERKIPVIMLTPKVGPMYSDTIEDYLRSGRSYSQTSLFRLDSGVFDEDLDME
ncbi:unnamed protein product [Mytilus coruscus]|uniref:DUF7042 domain-containing protein n=1 Tax=Mytilus coruscus TaxID=42192 RepID=A0A6J8A173_MYTCO|nr:unnamed protein product [Mytilus coruscus]